MQPPLVSVIIPTRNRRAYLKQAIDSVYAQTLEQFEVIVIDDGATDGTENITHAYDERLRYFKQDHAGVSAARNRAIDAAQGEYIAFLDDDDIYEPTKLEENVAYMQSHPDVVWLYSGFSFIDEHGNTLDRAPITPAKDIITLHDIALFTFIIPTTVMVHTAVLREAGGFPEGVKISEDYETWAKVLTLGKGAALKSCLAKFRQHPGNTTLPTRILLKQNTKVIDMILAQNPAETEPRQYYIDNLNRIIADNLWYKKQHLRYFLFQLRTFFSK